MRLNALHIACIQQISTPTSKERSPHLVGILKSLVILLAGILMGMALLSVCMVNFELPMQLSGQVY